MSEILVKNLGKAYPNGVEAVKNFNLQIRDGEFIVLLGPSGCGKSTMLMMLAGLEEITSGELYIDGVCVNAFTPKERDIGLVFQSYALLPNMTVYDNIGFGLTIRKVKKEEKDRRIRETAKILGLEEYLDRKPRHLSGGQRQRVAIGRCIVRDPKVFLFDEPLSNLDAKLRVQMRKELIKLHGILSSTMIYVTHDQVEAMTMAHRIVVMKDGEVQQIGTPDEVYQQPENLFVATFIGSPKMNIFNVKFSAGMERGRLTMPCGLELSLGNELTKKLTMLGMEGESLYMGIRPDGITQAQEGDVLTIGGEVSMVEMMGSEKYIYFKYFDDVITSRAVSGGKESLMQQMRFHLSTDKIVLFECKSGKRIS